MMEPAGDGREPSLDPIVERHNRCFWKGGYGFGEGWLLWGKRRLTLGVEEGNEHIEVPVTKDSESEGPIPSAWRPILKHIVDAFARQDYRLADEFARIAPVSEETATQVRQYIEDYGAKLVPLPKESWDTSVCIWMDDHRDALVDLWTEEEGSSDLVLQTRVSEAASGYAVTVYMVYVP
jgi:hypothetical protein